MKHGLAVIWARIKHHPGVNVRVHDEDSFETTNVSAALSDTDTKPEALLERRLHDGKAVLC